MSIMSKLVKQCRKPTGWLGRAAAWGMNRGHSEMTDWGLEHISIGRENTVLDVGCGGGETVRKLAKMATDGRVHGMDFSEESIAVARWTNRRAIRSGQVEIEHGTVSHLPFPDGTFDLVTAVETHYFWPDLVPDMREILRVLKPGGALAVMGEAYKGSKYDERNRKWVAWGDMAFHTIGEFGDLLSRAGYAAVHLFEEYEKGWMCGIGEKASQSVPGRDQ